MHIDMNRRVHFKKSARYIQYDVLNTLLVYMSRTRTALTIHNRNCNKARPATEIDISLLS